jgi:hypothetical protein
LLLAVLEGSATELSAGCREDVRRGPQGLLVDLELTRTRHEGHLTGTVSHRHRERGTETSFRGSVQHYLEDFFEGDTPVESRGDELVPVGSEQSSPARLCCMAGKLEVVPRTELFAFRIFQILCRELEEIDNPVLAYDRLEK